MHIELFLLVISLLFFASIFTDKLSSRFGVPALLLFLGVGMLFGSDGVGIEFEDIELARAFSTVALCVILFEGGLSTKYQLIKPVMKEGVMLATVGVLLTCLIAGGLIYGLLRLTHVGGEQWGMSREWSFAGALLIAATMSSTDASSVFSILRTRGIGLNHNLRPILELESGSNDPMAYILTVTLISVLTTQESISWVGLLVKVVWQLVAGIGVGFLFGRFIVWLMSKVKIGNVSLYPLLILTAGIFIFSATWFIGGNSFLAVYIGGLVIGNTKFAHKRHSLQFFNGISWLCQLSMFLILGLLINPSRLTDVIVPGLIVSAVMILVARPAAVFVSLMPFKHLGWRDKTLLSWVGLKGAVPIILGIQCMSAGVEGSEMLFHIAFFCTLISLLLQGTSLGAVAGWLGLSVPPPETINPSHFDIDLPEEILSQAIEMEVTDRMAAADGSTLLKDVSLPVGSLVMLIRRDDRYLVPKGATRLKIGDYLLVITEDRSALVTAGQQRMWELELMDHPLTFLREWAQGKEKPAAAASPAKQEASVEGAAEPTAAEPAAQNEENNNITKI